MLVGSGTEHLIACGRREPFLPSFRTAEKKPAGLQISTVVKTRDREVPPATPYEDMAIIQSGTFPSSELWAVPGLRRSIPQRSCCATPGTQWGGPYGNSLLCNTIMVPCPPSTVAAKV